MAGFRGLAELYWLAGLNALLCEEFMGLSSEAS
jgi:hypothetical protein